MSCPKPKWNFQKNSKFQGPDLKLSQTARETLAKIILDKNITGECFPLISKNDQLLKKIGVRQVFFKLWSSKSYISTLFDENWCSKLWMLFCLAHQFMIILSKLGFEVIFDSFLKISWTSWIRKRLCTFLINSNCHRCLCNCYAVEASKFENWGRLSAKIDFTKNLRLNFPWSTIESKNLTRAGVT